ncbi:MAG TPA: multidrug efflux RND transporter permease subunit [Vicinamibacterales bacterium]|nr:multidrug efflux RND transporter permease subunit [Vicinamibacterales bacterium]
MFVDVFIKRPILASVCAVVIVLAGAIAIPTLPVAQYPQLTPPQVIVTSTYTGASAQTVETAVTLPLEEAINGVEGMQYMTSTSTNQGISTITVTFDVNRDVDLAAVDVQNRVNQAEGLLPNEVKQVGVTVSKAAAGFVFGAAVYSVHNKYSPLFMSNYLDVYVKDALKRVPGVADVTIFAERKYAMRLWLDPDRLAARGLTAEDVVTALEDQNIQVAAGQIGQPPAATGQSYQISVRAVGRLTDPSQFDDIILKEGANGSLVRVKDVGYAELGAENYSSSLRFNGQPAVGLGITQLPTANTLSVYEAATKELKRLSAQFPPGLKYSLAFDNTEVVSASIREVVTTLLEAIGLVILVMFFFLQDWRATIIPSITIPVSLVGTFAFVKLFGFSINTLTLFGITLATGLVVDDAIVVVENVQRHIHEYGKSPRESASDAMREVVGPVVATALVLAAVFVPVALFPGTTGRLYQQFALTIAVSVAISAFNALTLTPSLAALILRGERPKGFVFRNVNKVIDGGTRGFVAALHRLVRWRLVIVLIFIAALGATVWVYERVPTGFVPDEDPGYFFVTVQGPEGASLQYTEHITTEAEQVLHTVPDIDTVFTVNGFSFLGGGSNTAMLFVHLKPFDQRPGEANSAMTIIRELYGRFARISGAVVLPFLPPAIQGVGQFGGFQFEVLDQGGASVSALAAATQQMVRLGNRTPGLTGLFSSFTADTPQLLVTVDRPKLKALGLKFADIAQTLQVLLGSVYVNDFDFNNRSYRVYVQANEQFRDRPADIGRYYVRTPSGQMVRLSDLVTIQQTTAPQIINHYNLFRSAEIDGSPAPGYSSGQALAAMEKLAKTLPAGMTFEWSGLAREEIKAGSEAVIIFGLGLLLVYLVLAAQYESVVLPFIILLSVPLALLGALLAQWARGLIDDVYCQIGLVMLIGLAAKNGILVVEFAEQLRDRGLSIVEAAIEAARIRLRPILMTSFAFILGVMPLVFAGGAGQNARHSVGTTVAGGMLVSTILNLVIIPVLYVVVRSLLAFGHDHRTHGATAAPEGSHE